MSNNDKLVAIGKTMMRCIFAAGGTGGHINPALAVAAEIRKRYPDAEILFLGTKEKMESRLVPAAGFNFRNIEISGFQRKKSFKGLIENIKTMFKVIRAGEQSASIMDEFHPDVVIGFGGYVSGPVLRKASKLGIKTVIHEQNAYPGVANKMLSKRADRVLLSVPEAADYLSCKNPPIVTGLPIREEVISANREKARKKLGIGDQTVIFSSGGSLGARTINDVASSLMIDLKNRDDIMFIHSYGQYGAYVPKILAENGISPDNPRFIVKEYIYHMADCLAAADIIISRAGASSISEIEAVGVASILIPSPNVAENHQYRNALTLSEKNAAILVEEKELEQNPNLVKEKILDLLTDKEKRSRIAENAKKLAITNAKDQICDIIVELVEQE